MNGISGQDFIYGRPAISADLVMIAGTGPGVDQSIVAGQDVVAVGCNPGAKSNTTSIMLLDQAIVETIGLYGLVVVIILMFMKPLSQREETLENRNGGEVEPWNV